MKTLFFTLTCLLSTNALSTGKTSTNSKVAIDCLQEAKAQLEKRITLMSDETQLKNYIAESLNTKGEAYLLQFAADNEKLRALRIERIALVGHMNANNLSYKQAQFVCEWLLSSGNIAPSDAEILKLDLALVKQLKKDYRKELEKFAAVSPAERELQEKLDATDSKK